MAKVTYTSLKLKINTDIKTFDFNGSQIEILQYLPINDKYSLINITLQEAFEDNIYNPLKKDVCFHLNLVFMYTNISFTEKQKEDLSKLYDTLSSSGLLNLIIENIPESEYEMLYAYIEELEEKNTIYQNTVGGVIKNIIKDLPLQAQEMQKIVENFDKEKFQNIIDFSKIIG